MTLKEFLTRLDAALPDSVVTIEADPQTNDQIIIVEHGFRDRRDYPFVGITTLTEEVPRMELERAWRVLGAPGSL